MNFQDLKIGTKLSVGFGALIAIAITLGLLAVFNMSKMRQESTIIDEEFLSELDIASDMLLSIQEVAQQMTAYNISEDPQYRRLGEKGFSDFKNFASQAQALAQRAENLPQLQASLNDILAQAATIESLMADAASQLANINQNRQGMDQSATFYMDNAHSLLNVQNQNMAEELARGGTDASRLEKIILINNIIDIGNEVRVANFKAQATRDVAALKAALGKFEQMNQYFAQLKPLVISAQNIAELEKTQAAAVGYSTAMVAFAANYEALQASNKEFNTAIDQIKNTVAALNQAAISETQAISKSNISLIDSSNAIMLVGLTLAAIFGFFLAYVITRSINQPLQEGVVFATRLAEGDLTAKLDTARKDEIGDLAKAMTRMVDKLRDIITNVKQSAENISSAGSQMSAKSQQVSQGANEQASSTEEVSSSMEQMSSNIQQNTDNAQQTQRIAQKAAQDIKTSSDNVNRTVSSMRTIAEKISIINEIAFQTNILALNAAVEAARAGEHGKGFAVVAAEVRKLAERSQNAAAEIDELSRNSVDIAETSGKLLENVVPDILKTASLVQEIAAASLEQNSGAGQINNAIQQLNQVTQQNAAAAEEMATSSEELSSQAEQLSDVMSFFNLGNEAVRSRAASRKPKARAIAHQPVQHIVFAGNKSKAKSAGIDIDLSEAHDDEYERF